MVNVPKFTKPFHYDVTTAPYMDAPNDVVNFELLGLFEESTDNSEYKKPVSYPPHYEDSHQFQFWLHQSMLSSMARSFEGMGMFPKSITDADLLSQIPEIFPDLVNHYGADAKYTVDIDIHEIYPNFIYFNQTMFLGRDDPLMLSLNVYADDELAINFIDEVAFKIDFMSQAFIANF